MCESFGDAGVSYLVYDEEHWRWHCRTLDGGVDSASRRPSPPPDPVEWHLA
jgi:hypothetical protein